MLLLRLQLLTLQATDITVNCSNFFKGERVTHSTPKLKGKYHGVFDLFC